MCGIFGIIGNSLSIDCNLLNQVTTDLRHRGPDDEGYAFLSNSGKYHVYGGNDTPKQVYSSLDFPYLPNQKLPKKPSEDLPNSALFGHRRLSIIDLSVSGHQPMCDESQKVWLTFNGEIYNYLELREELKQLGHNFKTKTDTEVLLKAWMEWEQGCVNHLEGMFAFAIWDIRLNLFFAARDSFGIKPFYYSYNENNELVFASEIPALIKLRKIEPEVNPVSSSFYLATGTYDFGENTFIENIYSLPPGHCLSSPLSSIEAFSVKRYWHLPIEEKPAEFEDAADQIRQIFLKSVKKHLRCDVPFGVALSGGIDSSAIACVMQHLYPDIEMKTISFVPHEKEFSEKQWCDIVGKKCNADMHFVNISSNDLESDFDALIRKQGIPFGDCSIYAQYKVFEKAHSLGIKVLLEGQGADEILAGYTGYPDARIRDLITKGRILKALKFHKASNDFFQKSRPFPFNYCLRMLLPSKIEEFFDRQKQLNNSSQWLLNKRHSADGMVDWQQNISYYNRGDHFHSRLAAGLTESGVQRLLRHGDRNSMAWSVENRVPFLNTELVNYCMSLPTEFLVDFTGKTKSVFRQAMRGIVPDQILDRKDKIGFTTPHVKLFLNNTKWIDAIFNESDGVGLLDIKWIREHWKDYMQQGSQQADTVWRWINFVRWASMFHVSNR